MELSYDTMERFTFRLLERLSAKYGGAATLNEIRTMHCVYTNPRGTTPSDIAHGTGIPRSTVTRSLATLQAEHWVVIKVDPDDHRRRIVKPSRRAGSLHHEFDSLIRWVDTHSTIRKSKFPKKKFVTPTRE